MSRSIAKKLWNASPASVLKRIQRQFEPVPTPGWHDVSAGPLAGYQIFLPTATGAWSEMVAGTFDSFIYEQIRKRGGLQNKVVCDIGAHFGYHSLCFAALGAEVFAFEPNSANADILKRNLQRNTRIASAILPLFIALADENGETTFVQSDSTRGESSGSHIASAQAPLEQQAYQSFRKITVPVARLDTLIEKREVKVPNVLKIDVEGAEHLVIKGAQNLLQNHSPDLYIEVHHIRVMCDLRGTLDDLGYHIEMLDAEHASPSRCFIAASRK